MIANIRMHSDFLLIWRVKWYECKLECFQILKSHTQISEQHPKLLSSPRTALIKLSGREQCIQFLQLRSFFRFKWPWVSCIVLQIQFRGRKRWDCLDKPKFNVMIFWAGHIFSQPNVFVMVNQTFLFHPIQFYACDALYSTVSDRWPSNIWLSRLICSIAMIQQWLPMNGASVIARIKN